MASTQTGTCLMMVALCFVLVLGSLSPCLPPLTFFTQASSSSSSPSSPPSADLYTSSQVRSRSLLFYNEGMPLEDNSLTVERGHQSEHHSHIQTSRYIGTPQSNKTTSAQFHKRDRETHPEGATEYF